MVRLRHPLPYLLALVILPVCGVTTLVVFRHLVGWHHASRTPEWIAQLQDTDPEVRESAALCLNEFAPPTTVVHAAFLDALRDTDAGVRRQAAAALGQKKFGAQARDAVPDLIEALNDSDPYVRSNAATSLQQIGVSREELLDAMSAAEGDPDEFANENVVR